MTCTLYTQIPMYVCVHVYLATYIIKYKTLSHLSEGAASDPMHICYTHTHTHTHTYTYTGGQHCVPRFTVKPRLSGVENHSFKHCWVSLWKLLNFPEPHLPYLQNGLCNLIFFIGLWGSDGLMHSQHFRQYLMCIRIQ